MQYRTFDVQMKWGTQGMESEVLDRGKWEEQVSEQQVGMLARASKGSFKQHEQKACSSLSVCVLVRALSSSFELFFLGFLLHFMIYYGIDVGTLFLCLMCCLLCCLLRCLSSCIIVELIGMLIGVLQVSLWWLMCDFMNGFFFPL